jgi:prolyl 4-hydroxylase
VYISETAPFQASATATFPGHVFLVKSKDQPDKVIHKWEVTSGKVLYVYDPIQLGTLKLTDLTAQQLEGYNLQKDNLKFAEQYKAATGIDYLSLYPLRPRPTNPIWPADYFGQEHSVLSRETHFEALPPPEWLTSISPAVQQEPVLKEYRTVDSDVLNMTLKVLSCAPRVFEIQNFMSKVEIDHVMKLATGMTLHQSSTKAGESGDKRLDDETRNSRNTWVPRGQSAIIDAIYRRAADLMQLDEAYMRARQKNEMPHLSTKSSNAELLQLVHYDVGQQYTPHHDFSIPSASSGQPMRFATILFYLNEGMKGGETTFPRWLNSEDPEPLKVVPEVGKAVLFYSLLPDGNMDDLSQHAAAPVTSGEKWLINLWTWDPMMKF